MNAIRISASDLDAYRYFRADEDSSLADFLDKMRKRTPPTESMKAGTALHAALETADPGNFERFEANGYRFDFDIDGELELPPNRELKAEKEYRIGLTIATVVGKVDAVHGRRVDDHKFTAKYDAERFLDSYQWRIYLDVFGADEFRWNVFVGRETEPKRYAINAFHRLKMHRYPGMGEDIEAELARFIEFARQHLPERLTTYQPLLMAG